MNPASESCWARVGYPPGVRRGVRTPNRIGGRARRRHCFRGLWTAALFRRFLSSESRHDERLRGELDVAGGGDVGVDADGAVQLADGHRAERDGKDVDLLGG